MRRLLHVVVLSFALPAAGGCAPGYQVPEKTRVAPKISDLSLSDLSPEEIGGLLEAH